MAIQLGHLSVGLSCLEQFPGGPAMYADVMLAGVEVEAALAIVLASISGSDPGAAATVLSHMRSIRDQEKAVLTVARDRLDPSDYKVLHIAARSVASHRQRRNDFAHQMWARSNDLPGAIFQISPSTFASQFIRMMPNNRRPTPIAGFSVSIEERSIYRENDVSAARSEASDARTVMMHAVDYVMALQHRGLDDFERSISLSLRMLHSNKSFIETAKRLDRAASA